MKKICATIIGLSCPKCKEKVKNALLAMDGIKDAIIEGERLTISYEGELSEELIKSTIESLGTYWVEIEK